MLNKLLKMIRRYDMIAPGDSVVCAVSGGADSMALLWSMYLLREKLGIRLSAAHFNHKLRGAESDRDEAFVREFCDGYQIPCFVGSDAVVPGKNGLEAAARDARYAFLNTLPGKIATAHTCDDNAETVLMHLVRGTGLKGLGAISPVSGKLIRPMLTVSRGDVEAFLAEYHIPHIEDSSNGTDAFLRNRIRHSVMPLLTGENPRFSENLSRMAMQLRQDEAVLSQLAEQADTVSQLRTLPPALRARALTRILKEFGIPEPETRHIAMAEALVFADNPSARADFPGGITLTRVYDRLEPAKDAPPPSPIRLPEKGSVRSDYYGVEIICRPAEDVGSSPSRFTVCPEGEVFLRSRLPGDEIRLPGGTRSLKKLFIDRKIPAALRNRIPVICDGKGILGVYGIGVNLDRAATGLPARQIVLESISESCKI